MKTLVLSMWNGVGGYFEECSKIWRRFGYDVQNVWPDGFPKYSHALKIKRVFETVRANQNEFTHVLVIDAFDVVVTASLAEVEKRFQRMGHPWIFNAERSCWPDSELENQYPACETPWRFLNAGCFMAEIPYFLEAGQRHGFESIDVWGDDQRFYTRLFLDHPGLIRLDHRCELFYTLFSPDYIGFDYVISEGRVENSLTGTQPLVIHGNGGVDQKRNIEPFIEYFLKVQPESVSVNGDTQKEKP
jgi:hypothetical protein